MTHSLQQQAQWGIKQVLGIDPGKLSTNVRTALTPAKLQDLMGAKLGSIPLTREQMVKITKSKKAAEAIKWLSRARIERLVALGFSTEQIVKIAGKVGASHTLEWLAAGDNVERLHKGGKGFSIDQIARIANHSSSKGALEWLAEGDNLERLHKGGKGFSIDQIARIANHDTSKGVLEWLAEDDNLAILERKNFKIDQIAQIATYPGALNTLKAIVHGAWEKVLSPEEVAELVSTKFGSLTLEWVLAHQDQLPERGNSARIFFLAQATFSKEREKEKASTAGGVDSEAGPSSETGPKKLSRARLKELEWQKADVDLDALARKGFNMSQIAEMAIYDGAPATLKAIEQGTWEGVLSPEEVVMLVSKKLGSLTLEWVLAHQDKLPEPGNPLRERFLVLAKSTDEDDRKTALTTEGLEGATWVGKRKRKRKRKVAGDGDEDGSKRARQEPVKREHTPFQFGDPPEEGMEVERVNTVQTRYIPSTTYKQTDLTKDPDNPVEGTLRVLHRKDALEASHEQVYDPELDKRFPIRDPANPSHVHPDYADPKDPTRCAPGVGFVSAEPFKDVTFTRSNQEKLWDEAQENFDSCMFTNKKKFLESVQRSVVNEIEATLRGQRPPSCEQVQVITLEEHHCETDDEKAALPGQYGCVLKDYSEEAQPSLRNGRIMGIFAGAKLESDEDDAAYRRAVGAKTTYEAKVGGVTWAPYGGGNTMQYLNSAFERGRGILVGSEENSHAMLVPVTLKLRDREGKERKETMLVVIQHRPVPEGQQIRLYYGPGYTLPLPEVHSKTPMELDSPSIKTEPVE